MKKITPLILVCIFAIQSIVSQTISQSSSLTITPGVGIYCNTSGGITRDNTFYRSFKLSDHGITSDYTISKINYGIEELSGAPASGFPVTVSIFTTSATFPTGTLTLINEVTENLNDQSEVLHATPIAAVIPAGSEFVVAISVESDATIDGGNGNVKFILGANNEPETGDTFIKTVACGQPTPASLSTNPNGFASVHLVMSVEGTSATAGRDDLAAVSFSYYPNPVKERLNMKADEEITAVKVYNILGQQVKSFAPSKLNANVDLTSLVAGTYFVKATVNDKTGSFKVIKE